MTKDEFVSWLKGYLDRCEQDQVATIREKLSLVKGSEIGYNYWAHVNVNRTSLAGDKLSHTIDTTGNNNHSVG